LINILILLELHSYDCLANLLIELHNIFNIQRLKRFTFYLKLFVDGKRHLNTQLKVYFFSLPSFIHNNNNFIIFFLFLDVSFQRQISSSTTLFCDINS